MATASSFTSLLRQALPDEHDQSAIKAHVLVAASGYFTIALLCRLTAPRVKTLCATHAYKLRGPLQQAASLVQNNLGPTLGLSPPNSTSSSPIMSTRSQKVESVASPQDTRNSTRVDVAISSTANGNGEQQQQQGEEMVFVEMLYDVAAAIADGRMETSASFGLSVGEALESVQNKISKIAGGLGVRACFDILAAYAVCVGIDFIREKTMVGDGTTIPIISRLFDKRGVVGTGNFSPNYSAEHALGTSYFVSSSFRFFLFGAFSFGSALNGGISHILRRFGLGFIDRALTVGTSDQTVASAASSKTRLSAFISRLAYFYDDHHRAIPLRNILLLPGAFLIKFGIFQLATHGLFSPMRLPCGLLPISFESSYVPTLRQLGPREIVYWIFLQKFVRMSTVALRMTLTGRWHSLRNFLTIMCLPNPEDARGSKVSQLISGLKKGAGIGGDSKAEKKTVDSSPTSTISNFAAVPSAPSSKLETPTSSYRSSSNVGASSSVAAGKTSTMTSVTASVRRSGEGNAEVTNPLDAGVNNAVYDSNRGHGTSGIATSSAKMSGSSFSAERSLATRLFIKGLHEVSRMASVYAVCCIGVIAVDKCAGSGGDAAVGASSNFIATAVLPKLPTFVHSILDGIFFPVCCAFHTRILSSAIGERKGVAYMWSLLG